MTQKQAIEKAVFAGRKLTGLKAVEMFGTLNLHKRIAELEKKYGVRLERTERRFKTRFGTMGRYTIYQLKVQNFAKEVANYRGSKR